MAFYSTSGICFPGRWSQMFPRADHGTFVGKRSKFGPGLNCPPIRPCAGTYCGGLARYACDLELRQPPSSGPHRPSHWPRGPGSPNPKPWPPSISSSLTPAIEGVYSVPDAPPRFPVEVESFPLLLSSCLVTTNRCSERLQPTWTSYSGIARPSIALRCAEVRPGHR